jgi:hypothetical protein
MPGLYSNTLPLATQLTGYETFPVDTQTLIQTPTTQGVNPQSVAATTFQLAALSTAIQVNTQTSTANAATSNTFAGRIVTEAVTTAAGANYTMTLTNSLVTATSIVQAAVQSGTNTRGPISIFSITPAAGTVVILVRNNGTLALNGTLIISWQVAVD